MKSILLVRHAKSDRNLSFQISDRDRPLNSRGKEDVMYLGKALRNFEFIPDLVISSPAVRAISTCKGMMSEAGYTGEIMMDERIYSGGLDGMMDCITEMPADIQSLAMYGHNPTITEAVRVLLKLPYSPVLPTGTMVLIQFYTQDWGRIQGVESVLVFYVVPRLLR